MKENIGFYCSSISWGGLEINFVRYALWLNSPEFPVIIYCVKGSKIDERLEGEAIEIRHVAHNKKKYDRKNAKRVWELFQKDNVKKVWIRDRRDFAIMAQVKARSKNNLKLIYQQAMQLASPKKDPYHTWMYKKIDAWIAPLQYLKEQVLKMTKVKEKNIYQIPLALAQDLNSLMIPKEEACKVLNVSSSKTYLGIIGRLDPLKGQLFVIKTLPALREKFPNLELLLIGDRTVNEGEEYLREIDATIAQLNLKDVVHIRPFMKNVEVAYSAIDVFCMASKGETFGMVTIDALACGVPLMGTNTSGTPELLGFGKFGWIYEEGNEEDFIATIQTMLNHPEERESKAKLAQKKALETYNKDNIVNALKDVINGL